MILDPSAIKAWNKCSDANELVFAEVLVPCLDIAFSVSGLNAGDIDITAVKNGSHALTDKDLELFRCKSPTSPYIPKPVERGVKASSSKPDSKARPMPRPRDSSTSDSRPKPSAPKKKTGSKVVKPGMVAPSRPAQSASKVAKSPAEVIALQSIIQLLSEVSDSAKTGTLHVVPEQKGDLKSSVSRITTSPFRSPGSSLKVSGRNIMPLNGIPVSELPDKLRRTPGKRSKSMERGLPTGFQQSIVDALQVPDELVVLQSIVEYLVESVGAVAQGRPIEGTGSSVVAQSSKGLVYWGV